MTIVIHTGICPKCNSEMHDTIENVEEITSGGDVMGMGDPKCYTVYDIISMCSCGYSYRKDIVYNRRKPCWWEKMVGFK